MPSSSFQCNDEYTTLNSEGQYIKYLWMVLGVCGRCWVSVDGAGCLWMVLGVCGWCWVSVDGAGCLWMVLGVCGWC